MSRILAWSLVLLGVAMMLCGCETVRHVDRVVVERPAVSPDLVRCRPEPAPLPPGARQRAIAPYVLDLVEAGADCRRKLGTVGRAIGATP
ncbi:hypothetical protein [Methylobacterium iners]|uniref:Lipoprotein n=1 Tax=Methylobacterium iners TaxID=418707 RepID=A0ABQ4S6M3_9HYPH|nr:hypothetical protein [Methylobacterium iners]GJD97458.1 hypothetical protein OCOJLMKI_4689 [Methylobacterium iners]